MWIADFFIIKKNDTQALCKQLCPGVIIVHYQYLER